MVSLRECVGGCRASAGWAREVGAARRGVPAEWRGVGCVGGGLRGARRGLLRSGHRKSVPGSVWGSARVCVGHGGGVLSGATCGGPTGGGRLGPGAPGRWGGQQVGERGERAHLLHLPQARHQLLHDVSGQGGRGGHLSGGRGVGPALTPPLAHLSPQRV